MAKSICHSCRFLTLGTFQVALYCRNAIYTKNSGSGSKLNTFSMAQQREIPNRVYAKSNLDSKCMCRLCCSVIDPKHCKSLYNKAGVNALASAELLYGEKLPREDSLSHHVCRSCERRLDNCIKFKNMVRDNSDSGCANKML